MPSLRIGFAGTPDFSVPTLEALVDWAGRHGDAAVVAAWSQPDRPAGRGRRIAMTPVKSAARAHGIAVHQPRTLRDDDALADFVAQRLDLLVVVAYGLILPDAVLEAPRLGCVNVHASLLPRWRGAAPVQRAILAGDQVSGVCIMQITAGLDSGPVWRTAAVDIRPDDTGSTLHDRLALTGAGEMVSAMPAILAGADTPRPQDETFATYASKISKSEARIDWRDAAEAIERKIRAFNAWPVAETRFAGRQLRIWAAHVASGERVPDDGVSPGTIVATGDGLQVQCGSGQLLLTRVQLAGGKPIDAQDFINAHDCAGTILGHE